MGLELSILGIRRINDEEIKELTGKTRAEMRESKFFRQFFPAGPTDSWYSVWSRGFISKDKDIPHLYSPVKDANGDELYVLWVEVLASYWHKNPSDREQIELFLEDAGEIDWDQRYHVVEYEDIRAYTRRKPSVTDPREELVAFIYG